MSANFTPDMKPYNEPSKFRYWVQSTLPMVYDDSLTYYELLSKVIAYINNLIEDNKTMIDNIDEVYEAFNNLQDYVNNYFDNLDLNPIIDQKVEDEIMQLLLDGRMLAIIENLIITSYVPQFVNTTEEMTERNVVYVLISDKHIYCYSSDAQRFVDTGVIFGDTTEYFTMRGILANLGSLQNPGDAGLYYLSGSNNYLYTPEGFIDGTDAWELCFTWSNQGIGAPANKFVIVYQGNHVWFGSRVSGWFFDNYDSIESVNTSNYAAASCENTNAEIEGGITNLYYGTIGRLGAANYNVPAYDLRHSENRFLVIPVESGNYIRIKAKDFGYNNYCACGFVSQFPPIPTRDEQSFLDIYVNTNYSSAIGKLIMLTTNNPQSDKIMVVNTAGIKYFIVSYRNMETATNDGYMLNTLKIYKDVHDYNNNVVLKDYLAASDGLKKEFADLKEEVESQISYDIEFTIENNYLSKYLNCVSYINDNDDYSFSLIANNGNFKPMNDVFRDENGSIPAGFTMTWNVFEAAVGYVIKFGSQTFTSNTNSCYIYNVKPGIYDFEIAAVTTSTNISNKYVIKTGRAKVSGRIRMMDIDDIYNCRDLGGWSTICGKKIKYGLFFRSAELDNANGYGELTTLGLNEFRKWNVLAEIDLDENENQSLDHYAHIQVQAYETGLTASSNINYGAIINKFADNLRAGYGTLVHCFKGTDRTGTVCYLLEGLLGVSEDQLAMDYEISSMNDFQENETTGVVNRTQAYRNYTNFVDMVDYIKNNFAGNNINEKIEAMLLTLGATQANIDYLKANALE